MTRFKSIVEKISNVDNDLALTTMKNRLWHKSKFREETMVNRLSTIEDAIHRASNFARAKEENSLLAKQHSIHIFHQNHRSALLFFHGSFDEGYSDSFERNSEGGIGLRW